MVFSINVKQKHRIYQLFLIEFFVKIFFGVDISSAFYRAAFYAALGVERFAG